MAIDGVVGLLATDLFERAADARERNADRAGGHSILNNWTGPQGQSQAFRNRRSFRIARSGSCNVGSNRIVFRPWSIDIGSLIGAVVVLVLTGVVAAVGPAFRAVRVDPVESLRTQ